MKSKIRSVIRILEIVFQKPSLILKLFGEISRNGFFYSFQKIKNKVNFPQREKLKIKNLASYKARKKILVFPLNSGIPKVSILISFSGDFLFLKRCLWSILKNPPEFSYEVIVLDYDSKNMTNFLKKTIKNVSFIKNDLNLNLSEFCNRIAQESQSEMILFLDSRVQVESGCLDFMVKLMNSDQSIGMVGSKLLSPNGNLLEAGKIIWANAHWIQYGNHEDPNASDFNYVKEVDFLSSLCCLVKKSKWDDVGGFDGSYSLSAKEYRDADLAFSLRKKGAKVVYQPKSLVVSFESPQTFTQESFHKIHNDRERFQEKWKKELDQEQFSPGQDMFLARDRSRKKKRIIIIDHYVPTFDQDAGSRAIWKYLELLKNIGYQVTFVPDNFFALEPYTSELEQKGIYLKYGPEAKDSIQEWIVSNAKYFDFALLSRPSVSIKYIPLIRENSNAKIIYFGHDFHFARLEKEYALTQRADSYNEMKQVKEEELFLFSKADLVLMFNKEEVEFINQFTKSKKAKKINLFFYKKIPIGAPKIFSSTKKQALFIGGFQHRPNVDGIVWFSEKIIPLIKKLTEDFRLIIVGSNPPTSVRNLAKIPGVEVLGYVDEITLEHLYQESRVAVIPLRYGAGVKGKTVEAMCHGIPVISTSTGAEGLEEVEHFILVEDDPVKMAISIADILGSPEIWDIRSKLSTQYALSHFSYDCVQKEFEALLKNLLVQNQIHS